jgi:hypothetical protein
MVATARHLTKKLVPICLSDGSMSATRVVVGISRLAFVGKDLIHVDVECWMSAYRFR